MPNPADPNAFAAPLAEMEAHIKDAEARGEDVPSQAYVLVAKLRELIAALEELDGTIGPGAQASGEAAPPDTGSKES